MHCIRITRFITLLILLACGKSDKPPVRIAAASSTQFAIEALADEFTRNSGIECQVILGSSGKLTAQIAQGAPFDIFISADMKFPSYLYERELATEPPQVYASGELAIWTSHSGIDPVIGNFTKAQVRHIAIADPKTAPYGEASVKMLKAAGVYQALQDKLVFGESIGQVNQFILSGAAEAGITAKSIVAIPNTAVLRGKWASCDTTLYEPLEQGALLLASAESNTAAKRFYEFLFSDSAVAILKQYGYLAPLEQ